jgi:hypothetical protein
LTVDQYKALLKAIPDINASLKRGGIDIGDSVALEDDELEDEPKLKRKAKDKKEKSNIEETSDEDDE